MCGWYRKKLVQGLVHAVRDAHESLRKHSLSVHQVPPHIKCMQPQIPIPAQPLLSRGMCVHMPHPTHCTGVGGTVQTRSLPQYQAMLHAPSPVPGFKCTRGGFRKLP